ncbi:MAG: hypothetical protein AAFV25_07240 [Bacteroidota bacterium]
MKYKYKAFISYKHSEISRTHAIALETALKRYAKPLFSRPMKIFRDEKHMVPDSDLSKLITDGLEQSEFLFFLAEKGSATSTWCQDELEYWCGTLKRVNNMIIVFVEDDIVLDFDTKTVDWEKTTALPSLLSKYLSGVPLYVDLKWARRPEDRDLQNVQYKAVINNIMAKLRHTTPEELTDEEIRTYYRNIRLRNLAVILLSLFLLVALAASLIANRQRQKAETNFLLAAQRADSIRQVNDSLVQQKRLTESERTRAEDNAKLFELQRDTAINERTRAEQAEQIAIEKAEASRLAALALGHSNSDPTQAVRLAERAFRLAPEDKGNVKVFHDLFSHPDYLFCRRSHRQHSDWVLTLANGPDDQYKLSGGADGRLLLWQNEGEEAKEIRLFADTILEVDFLSPKAIVLLRSSGTLHLLDASGKDLRAPIHRAGMTHLAVDRKRKIIGVGDRNGTLQWWDHELTSLDSLVAHRGGIIDLAVSSKGEWLSTATDNKVLLWGQNRQKVATLPRELGLINTLCFGPAGEKVAMGRLGGELGVYSLADQQMEWSKGHKHAVQALSFSPDGKYLLSGDEQGLLLLTRLTDGLVKRLSGHSGAVYSLCHSPSQKMLWSAGADGSLRLWPLSNHQMYELEGHTDRLEAVCLFSNGEKLVSCGADGRSLLWDGPFYKQAVELPHQGVAKDVHIDSNGSFWLACSDNSAYHLDADGNQLGPKRQNTLGGAMEAIVLSASGQMISGHQNGRVYRWVDQKAVALKKQHAARVKDLQWPRGAGNFLSLGEEGNAFLWDRKSRFLGTLEMGNLSCVDYEPALGYILGGTSDGGLALMNARGKVIWQRQINQSEMTSVSLSPDGRFCLAGSDNGAISLLDKRGRLLRTYTGHESEVLSLEFWGEGQFASSSLDNSFRIWPTLKKELSTDRLMRLTPLQRLQSGLPIKTEDILAQDNPLDLQEALTHLEDSKSKVHIIARLYQKLSSRGYMKKRSFADLLKIQRFFLQRERINGPQQARSRQAAMKRIMAFLTASPSLESWSVPQLLALTEVAEAMRKAGHPAWQNKIYGHLAAKQYGPSATFSELIRLYRFADVRSQTEWQLSILGALTNPNRLTSLSQGQRNRLLSIGKNLVDMWQDDPLAYNRELLRSQKSYLAVIDAMGRGETVLACEVVVNYSWDLMMAGQFEESVRQASRALECSKSGSDVYLAAKSNQSLAYFLQKEYAKAAVGIEEIRAEYSDSLLEDLGDIREYRPEWVRAQEGCFRSLETFLAGGSDSWSWAEDCR